MKKPDLSSLVPAGVSGRREILWTLAGLCLSAVVGVLAFLFKLWYVVDLAQDWLEEGAPRSIVPPFREVLSGTLFCFLLVGAAMAGLLIYHIDLHYRGSRSIYLMRRLRHWWELPLRCAALPLAGLLCSFLAWGLTQLVLFWLYIALTPQIHLGDLYRDGFLTALLRGGVLC